MAKVSTQERGLSRLFNDRKIATKIMMGFAIVLAITAIISAVAYFAFDKVSRSVAASSRQAANGALATAVDQNFLFVRWSVREYALAGDPAFLEQANKGFVTLSASIQKAEASLSVPERKAKMAQIGKEIEEYKKGFAKVASLKQEQISLAKDVLDPSGVKLRNDFEELQAAAAKAGNSNMLTLAGEGLKQIMLARLNVNKLLGRHDESAAASAEKAFADLKLVFTALDGATKGDARKVLDDIKELSDKYRDAFLKAATASHDQDNLVNGEMKKIGGVVATQSQEIKTAAIADSETLQQETAGLIGGTETFILMLAAGGLILGAFLAWLIGRAISRPIVMLVPELKKLADGDFNIVLPGLGRKDEIGQISDAAEMVAEKVGMTISNIKVSANEVTSASAEISTSTTDLSQRTEEQAASLEETAASMEEMTATVKKNAENAQQASELAVGTRQVADRGGEVVSKAVDAMARIEESSRKISDIISVIDEIARQTNLLALNAAVEAARAGDAGRGFAVVASEVRSLAQRSSQAAKDIKDLITSSSSQVKDGVDLVNRAGESLSEIVSSIKKVTDVVSEIANASIEQSAGIDQIGKALAQMDEVTQQNSALVEENAATAKTLEHQAKSMDERVAIFRLRGDSGEAEASSAPGFNGTEDAAASIPVVAAAPRRAPAPVSAPVQLKRPASTGRRGSAATAMKEEPEWKEF